MTWVYKIGGHPPPPIAQSDLQVNVFEVTMVAPDMLCFEIRDQKCDKGYLWQTTPQTGLGYNGFSPFTEPGTGLTRYGEVLGVNKDWVRFADWEPTNFLNRAAIDNPANWPQIGGLTVISVTRKSQPFDQATSYNGGVRKIFSLMRHYVYVKLSGNLAQGSYTINYPSGTGLSATSFTFNDKTTRCHALRATQNGHRPSDDAKIAYLSVFLPKMSSIDYINSYGITSFNIIDNAGNVVFTGTTTDAGVVQTNRFQQRVTPTTVEAGASLQYYGDTTDVKYLSGITQANPIVVNCVGHGYSAGKRIQLRNLGSSYNANPSNPSVTAQKRNNYIGTVGTVVDVDHFILNDTSGNPVDGSSDNAYVAGIFAPGFDGQIVGMKQVNRANAYVFGLDYSAWTTGNGTSYRVQIPGIGVSYPFDVNDGVWLNAAKKSCGGFYNQLNGIALDGRFGWTRPAAFIDGVTPNTPTGSTEIYWSKLPGLFTNECQYGSPITNLAGFGSTEPWLTTTRATGIYGGYRDGGDFATILWSHAGATYYLLAMNECAVAYGGTAATTNFNFPRMSAVLDPVLYAGTDSLPDLVHQAMWEIDFYRRTQQADGSVAGGILFGDGGTGDGQTAPSWLWRYQVALYAADHVANYAAALLFAKAALTFKSYGFTGTGSLTDVYTTAAINAFNWAEGLYNNPTAQDAYYNGTLGLSTYITNNTGSIGSGSFTSGSTTVVVPNGNTLVAGNSFGIADSVKFAIFTVASVTDSTHVVVTAAPTRSGSGAVYGPLGWTNSQFTTAMSALDASGTGASGGTAYQTRAAACGALYRLTGTSSYATQIVADPSPPGTAFWKMVSQWEYINSGGAINSTVLANFNTNLNYTGSLSVIEGTQSYIQGASGHGSIGYGPGDGGTILMACGPWQHVPYPGSTVSSSVKQRWRRAIQATANFCHGANQYGYCWVSGLGARNVNSGTLLRDREMQGSGTPVMPDGYTNYAIFNNVGGPGGFANLVPGGGPSNFNTTNPVNDALGVFSSPSYWRLIEPSNYDFPQVEQTLENTEVIFNMEYTTEQTTIPQQVAMHFLNGWDGN